MASSSPFKSPLDTSKRIAFIGKAHDFTSGEGVRKKTVIPDDAAIVLWYLFHRNIVKCLQTLTSITLGGGNMASAMIGGLLANAYPSTNIVVSEPIPERAAHLKAHFHVNVASTNEDALKFTGHPSRKPADIVILAVKPQVMKPVAVGIAKAVQATRPLVITIAAGIRTVDLNRWLSSDENGSQLPSARNIAIVRAMPNTPALVLEGATALFAGLGVTSQQKIETYNVIDSVSNRTYWVEQENLLDVVTALSGTGPAYFFLMIEALEQAGHQLGKPFGSPRRWDGGWRP